VHSDRVLVTAVEKERLFQASGGDAVEMESSGIVAVCRTARVPVGILRVISDTATEDLPIDFNRFCREDGSLSLPRLLWGLGRSPGVIPELVRFEERLRHAAGQLADTLQRFLAQINPSGSSKPTSNEP
jgi:adenosylhomocysteine nucleosidase